MMMMFTTWATPLRNAGYNFMFVNGAIAGNIYAGRGLTNDGVSLERRYQQSERYGRDGQHRPERLTTMTRCVKTDWDTIINKKWPRAARLHPLVLRLDPHHGERA